VTTLLDRTHTAPPGQGRGVTRLPTGPRRRRPLWTVASALVVLASVAIFSGLYSSADHQVAVVMVTRTIEQGQRITGSDLGSVGVSTSGGLAPIPVADASELSGTWAKEAIPAGSLLTLGNVTSTRPLTGGTAVVGLALKEGQLPSGGVEPGDQVMIVLTPGAGSVLPATGSVDGTSDSTNGADDSSGADGSSGVLVAKAAVFGVATPSASSSSAAAELVSVQVPTTLAASVATAAASDQVSVVLLPSGSSGSSGSGSSGSSGSSDGSAGLSGSATQDGGAS
jgi:hypothetical protein